MWLLQFTSQNWTVQAQKFRCIIILFILYLSFLLYNRLCLLFYVAPVASFRSTILNFSQTGNLKYLPSDYHAVGFWRDTVETDVTKNYTLESSHFGWRSVILMILCSRTDFFMIHSATIYYGLLPRGWIRTYCWKWVFVLMDLDSSSSLNYCPIETKKALMKS